MAEDKKAQDTPPAIKVKETHGPTGFSQVMHSRVYTLKPGEPIPANAKKVPDSTEEYDWKVDG